MKEDTERPIDGSLIEDGDIVQVDMPTDGRLIEDQMQGTQTGAEGA